MSFIRAKETPPHYGNWYGHEVSLYRRWSVSGTLVYDATLTPMEVETYRQRVFQWELSD